MCSKDISQFCSRHVNHYRLKILFFLFDDKGDIHMIFDNYEASGFRVCDLLIIPHELRVTYPTRSGCKEESIQITHVYFKALACK